MKIATFGTGKDGDARHSRWIRPWLIALILVGMTLLIVSADFSTVTAEKVSTSEVQAPAATTAWSVPYWLVPGSDGSSLFVFTGAVAQVDGTTNAGLTIGGGARVSIGMTYDAGGGNYEGEFSEIPVAGSGTTEGTIGLTATLENGEELSTIERPFKRYTVPQNQETTVVSSDQLLEAAFSENSLPIVNAYVLVMTTNSPPKKLPTGHALIGQTYSLRASSAIVTTDKPLLLSLSYSDVLLGPYNPHTLVVLQWQPAEETWVPLDSTLDDRDNIGKTVTALTSDLTIYALAAGPYWYDELTDFTAVPEHNGVDILVGSGELILENPDQSNTGFATTHTIIPTTAIENWKTVTYTATVPTDTVLTIDILDNAGNVIMADVASGVDLSGLDPQQLPALRLRATLSTSDNSKTPSLDIWRLDWVPRDDSVYLPLLIRSE